MSDLRPILLGANQPERFYRGGARIDRFRGAPVGRDYRPEDWVGATTTIAGEHRLGLSTLPDGRLLADAVTADPESWLGADHLHAYGAETMILVKLLDAGQRLPVHAHPSDAFAHAHVHSSFGKAEAWYILEPGVVHLGLRRALDRDELRKLVDAQDVVALLDLLHRRTVAEGDVVYVPPGMLHAIGEGVLLLEVQQSADVSILLEWEGFALDGARDGHLGLGFDLALQAVMTDAAPTARLDELIHPAGVGFSVLPAESERFFRLERHVLGGRVIVDSGFAILVVERGEVAVEWGGGVLPGHRGTTIVVPHAAGELTLSGDGTVLVCRPPAVSQRADRSNPQD